MSFNLLTGLNAFSHEQPRSTTGTLKIMALNMNVKPQHNSRFGREYHGHRTQDVFKPYKLPHATDAFFTKLPRPDEERPQKTSQATPGTVIETRLPSLKHSDNLGSNTAGSQPSSIPCGICRKAFDGTRPATLFAHLGGHFNERYVYHRCEDCRINFVTEHSLREHLLSAQRGSCGFLFEHTQACTGHHRPRRKERHNVPSSRSRWRMKDDDRFDFCYRIRGWEEVQVSAVLQTNRPDAEAGTVTQPRSKSRSLLLKLAGIFTHSCTRNPKNTQSNTLATSPVTTHFARSEMRVLGKTSVDLGHEASNLLGATLLRAICTGSTELVASLLHADCNVHVKDMFGFGPMLYAAHYGSPEIIDLLVRRGGLSVHEVDARGKSPLGHAISRGRSAALVSGFLRHGAELQSSHLCEAVNAGDNEMADVLVEQWTGSDRSVEVLDHLLRLAVAQRDRRMAQLLLDYGAEPDEWNELDCVSLAAAARYRHLAMVELLFAKDIGGGCAVDQNVV